MLAVPIASAIGTPLAAWLIQNGNGVFGLAGWRFMMICLGLPAVLLGAICWFYLTDRPSDAHWLTDDQRAWLTATLAAEEHEVASRYHYPLRRTLTSPRVWALAVVYFGVVYGLYALAFFLPSIVAGFRKTFGMHLSLIQVGLITAIPYAFGALAMFLWSRHADRTRDHVWHVAIPLFVGGLAIPVALYLKHPITVMVLVVIDRDGHLRRVAGVLGVTLPVPRRRGRRGWDRADQLGGKSRRFRRPLRDRSPGGPDRNGQGGHVGGRGGHGARRGPGRLVTGHPEFDGDARPGGRQRVVPSVPTHRLIGSYERPSNNAHRDHL